MPTGRASAATAAPASRSRDFLGPGRAVARDCCGARRPVLRRRVRTDAPRGALLVAVVRRPDRRRAVVLPAGGAASSSSRCSTTTSPCPRARSATRWSKWPGAPGVPEDRIFVYDGSRQSNNFTANVSGLGGSARDRDFGHRLQGRLARRGQGRDRPRDRVTTCCGHVWRTVILMSALAVVFFFLADRLFPRFARAFGSRAAIGDPTGLPVLVFMVSLFLLLRAATRQRHDPPGRKRGRPVLARDA